MEWVRIPCDFGDSIDEFRPAPLPAFFTDPKGVELTPPTEALSPTRGVLPAALGEPTGVLRASLFEFPTPPTSELDAEAALLPVPPPPPPRRLVPLPVLLYESLPVKEQERQARRTLHNSIHSWRNSTEQHPFMAQRYTMLGKVEAR